jgi:hypothetical protein
MRKDKMSNGSFNRAKPTAAGGELKKVMGDLKGFPIDPNFDAELDERMRYAEATGQYDPWKQAEEENND